jgi:hypothetical protein
MIILKKDLDEFEKCRNDIYYFYNKYVTIKMKKNERILLEGREFEEIKNIYLKYFSLHPEYHRNIIYKIEKVTIDDDIDFVISFEQSKYESKCSIDYFNTISYLRMEKIKKLCQNKLL